MLKDNKELLENFSNDLKNYQKDLNEITEKLLNQNIEDKKNINEYLPEEFFNILIDLNDYFFKIRKIYIQEKYYDYYNLRSSIFYNQEFHRWVVFFSEDEDFNKKKYCLKNNNNTNKDLICSYAIIMSPAGGINDYSTFIISDEIELAIKCTDRILLKFF